jgi:hypothetical protein
MINRPPRPQGRDLRALLSDDRGTSLIEVVVGMLIMTIFMGMFTGAVVIMNSAERKVEAVNNTSTQLNQAFLSLDRTVRYAAAISQPSSVSGNWYVELLSSNTGTKRCTQYRLDTSTRQLQKRTWTVNSSPSDLTVFIPVASNVSNGGGTSGPFVLTPPASTEVPFQQLVISLKSADAAPAQTISGTSFGFGAVNSTVAPPSTPVCQEAGQQ